MYRNVIRIDQLKESPNVGSNLAMEMVVADPPIKMMAGGDLVTVTYRGSAPAFAVLAREGVNPPSSTSTGKFST